MRSTALTLLSINPAQAANRAYSGVFHLSLAMACMNSGLGPYFDRRIRKKTAKARWTSRARGIDYRRYSTLA